MEPTKGGKFISLKEAAEISGYAPDYIGQLIRSGRLPGQQVYANIAWMTTEDAIRSYMERSRAQENGQRRQSSETTSKLIRKWPSAEQLFRSVVYVALGVSIALSLFLFYVLSVRLNDNLERRVIQSHQANIELR